MSSEIILVLIAVLYWSHDIFSRFILVWSEVTINPPNESYDDLHSPVEKPEILLINEVDGEFVIVTPEVTLDVVKSIVQFEIVDPKGPPFS